MANMVERCGCNAWRSFVRDVVFEKQRTAPGVQAITVVQERCDTGVYETA